MFLCTPDFNFENLSMQIYVVGEREYFVSAVFLFHNEIGVT